MDIETPDAAVATAAGGIVIVANAIPGLCVAGHHHPARAVYPRARWSDDELITLAAEPALAVVVLDGDGRWVPKFLAPDLMAAWSLITTPVAMDALGLSVDAVASARVDAAKAVESAVVRAASAERIVASDEAAEPRTYRARKT